MNGKKIMLALGTEMYSFMEQRAKANLMTVQELIRDDIRKRMLAPTPKK